MATTSKSSVLATRTFAMSDQAAFAKLSGDFNPLHVDPIAARRMFSGGVVVHGLHLVVSALEAFAVKRAKVLRGKTLGALRVTFRRPVLVGESIAFHLVEAPGSDLRIDGMVGEGRVCDLIFSLMPASVDAAPPSFRNEKLLEADFAALAEAKGELPVGLDLKLARKLFTQATKGLGAGHLAELLALTRLVGMRCPGLHSVFGGFSVAWETEPSSWRLKYQVANVDDRFRRLDLDVSTQQMAGRVTAFVRPPPEPQPTVRQLSGRVKKGEFADARALVIGGSRGLGEITAKLIAAGGGSSVITYHQGAKDATAVAREIREFGGACETVKFDVLSDPTVLLRQLRKKSGPIGSLYYFATPRIFGPRQGFFDHGKLHAFESVYVTAFGRLIDALGAENSVRVFYPSSIAVEENPRELAEYSMAKVSGEMLCAFYNRASSTIKIVSSRLPRIRTDQTSTLMPFPAEEAVDVMLPLVRQVESGT